MEKKTTAQQIIHEFDRLGWIEFCMWIRDNADALLKHNKEDLEYAHFHGGLKQESAADYYRSHYNPYMDGLRVEKFWHNSGEYRYKLIYHKQVVDEFISFEEAIKFVESNYDRATDTIKKN